MAELADVPDLGSGAFGVQVQVLSGAPTEKAPYRGFFYCVPVKSRTRSITQIGSPFGEPF